MIERLSGALGGLDEVGNEGMSRGREDTQSVIKCAGDLVKGKELGRYYPYHPKRP